MPAKRPGTITLTFAKRNKDVRKILDDKLAENENFVTTDYICDAIRYYKNHGESAPTADLSTLTKLVEQLMKAAPAQEEEAITAIDLERVIDASQLGDD